MGGLLRIRNWATTFERYPAARAPTLGEPGSADKFRAQLRTGRASRARARFQAFVRQKLLELAPRPRSVRQVGPPPINGADAV